MSFETLCAKRAAAMRPSAVLMGGHNKREYSSHIKCHTARVGARFCHREKTASFGLSFLRAPEAAGAP